MKKFKFSENIFSYSEKGIFSIMPPASAKKEKRRFPASRFQAIRLAPCCALSCRPPFQRLGVANLIAWFTFISRTTGLRAVGVFVGLVLPPSRGGFTALPRPWWLYYITESETCQEVFVKKFKFSEIYFSSSRSWDIINQLPDQAKYKESRP